MSDKGIFWKMYAHLAGCVCAASGRRPDCGCWAEWTPCAGEVGVQIWDLRRIGRHVRVGAASRLGMLRGMDAM